MSYWNGSAWVEREPDSRPTESRATRWAATGLMILGASLLVLPFSAASAGQGSSSVWVESGAGVRLASGDVHYGDAFRVGYSTRERQPWAHVVCRASSTSVFDSTYPDGSIWGMYYSVYPGGPSPQAFVAGQSVDGNWSSGGANCRVDLLKYSNNYARWTVLASGTFTVEP